MKAKGNAKAQFVPPDAEVNLDEIPKELKCLLMTPTQYMALAFPEIQTNPQAKEAIAGLMSGVPGYDLGVTVPDWARKASAIFWKASGLPMTKPASEWTPIDLGQLIGLFETRLPPKKLSKKAARIEKAFGVFAGKAKSAMNDEKPEVARDFHAGRAKAPQVTEKFATLSKRSQIYMAIAVGWRIVEKFKGQAELRNWLMTKDEKGNSFLSEFDYSDPMREFREITSSIGLRFNKRPGRKPRSG